MSFFIVCMIMRSHNLLSFNLGIGDWRFSITRLEAKRFQINMSVMHTTIHHAAQKPHTPTQKDRHCPKRPAVQKRHTHSP